MRIRLSAAAVLLSLAVAAPALAAGIDSDSPLALPTPFDHVRGDAEAKITMIVYASLECPFCKKVYPTLKSVVIDSGDRVNLVFRHFPLSFETHSRAGALGAECVYSLKGTDAFWRYIDAYYASQTPEAVKTASGVGVDIKECMRTSRQTGRIDRDLRSGAEAGVSGVPTVFIVDNETKDVDVVIGSQPAESYRTIINDMLSGTWQRTMPEPDRGDPYPTGDFTDDPVPAPDRRGEYLRGRIGARFVLVEYMNFAEPFSLNLHPTIKRLLARRSDVAWVLRTADLDFLDRSGIDQAKAVICSGKLKGRYAYWRMADIIVARHNLSTAKMSAAELRRTALRLGMGEDEYDACMADEEVAERVEGQIKDAAARFDGVPVVVVVDTRTGSQTMVAGAYPLEHFVKLMEGLAGY